jgi:hypothetical protein
MPLLIELSRRGWYVTWSGISTYVTSDIFKTLQIDSNGDHYFLINEKKFIPGKFISKYKKQELTTLVHTSLCGHYTILYPKSQEFCDWPGWPSPAEQKETKLKPFLDKMGFSDVFDFPACDDIDDFTITVVGNTLSLAGYVDMLSETVNQFLKSNECHSVCKFKSLYLQYSISGDRPKITFEFIRVPKIMKPALHDCEAPDGQI